MSIQENIKLDEEMIALANAHDLDRYMEYWAEDIVTTIIGQPEPLRGKAAVRQQWQGNFEAFSDHTIVVKYRTVTEDTIVTEVNFGGTNDGPLQLGPGQTLPPTGRTINVEGIYVNKVRDGKVVESRQYPNLMGFMAQLGLLGEPQAA